MLSNLNSFQFIYYTYTTIDHTYTLTYIDIYFFWLQT